MKKGFFILLFILTLSITWVACTSQGVDNVKKLTVKLDFQTFPKVYTCDGRDISPPIHISGIPDGTKSLAIVMDDPDAPIGTFVHWVAWNITPTNTIPENIPKAYTVAQNGISMNQGTNDFRKVGYGGPCPPRGHGIHHYHIKVYALDTTLNLSMHTTKDSLLKAMKGHILAEGEAVATYQR